MPAGLVRTGPDVEHSHHMRSFHWMENNPLHFHENVIAYGDRLSV
jgi:hypothetical protein